MDENLSDLSSENGSYYSDHIDSDIEAELYSIIHHDLTDNSTLSQENINTSQGNVNSFQENVNSSQISSVQPGSDSVLSKSVSFMPENELINGNKKNTKRNSTMNVGLFVSDGINDSNLFTSFETPKKYAAQNSQNKSFEKTGTNKSVKRKSAVIAKFLDNTVGNNSGSNSRLIHCGKNSFNQTTSNTHLNKKFKDESFVVVETDSSDSDSSVYITVSDESHFKTNVKKETIVLSSDSDESDSSTERMFVQSCQVKRNSLPGNYLNSNQRDPWHINTADAFRSRRLSNRYHEKGQITCSNCNVKGHMAKYCPAPKTVKCFICGGDHSWQRCSDKMCSRCSQKGHDYKRCFSYTVETCFLCNMPGHSGKCCPDLWRRYHLTTSLGKIIKGKQSTSNSSIFCYNCGFEGHYGAECARPRMDSTGLPTWTSVISYDNPIGTVENKRVIYNSKENTCDRNIRFPSKKKQPKFAQDSSSQHKIKNKIKPKVSPKEKNKIGKEVYFPRTPKTAVSTSADMTNCNGPIIDYIKTLSKKKLYKLRKRPNDGTPEDAISDYLRTLSGKQINKLKGKPSERRLKAKQKEHKVGLQRRLGFRATKS
ncbi:zinc finger CCHC domain-containing protein 7 [Trichonephila clavipes]|uniref:Zinc finger CCHC domain-containing protein 7 n=1 Tax=Trichonephila clavipes TaxID=2585209 RepID=A0A8X6WLW0_TRICX|nr:zinc finger CCHC domain-containing protein 7 [Trichonephila clavipes]